MRWPRVAFFVVILLFACDASPAGTDASTGGDGGGKLDDPTALSHPTHGFTNYTTLPAPWDVGFCPDIRLPEDPELGNVHTIINSTNAHYLGYIAGNAYADFVHFAPPMEELGFGMPGEGARLATCGADLVRMRLWDAGRQSCGSRGCRPNPDFDPLVDDAVLELWGECAAEWYLGRFGPGTEAPEGVDDMFEVELTATAHYGARLEFFSGGEFDVGSQRFDKGTTQLIWAEHREQPLLIIAFRGTEFQDGAEDLWADLNVGKDPFHDWGEVHQGFLNALDSVMPLLDDKLSEIEGTDTRIWVTGHSLGAALATLFTARLLQRLSSGAWNYRLVGTYTFGSPRVGDEAFRDRFEALAIEHGVSVWRFRNDRDIVTRVPSGWRFDHVGGLAHFEDDTIVLRSMLDETVPRGIISDLWEHHFMSAYYDRLEVWNDPGGLRPFYYTVDAVYNCIPASGS